MIRQRMTLDIGGLGRGGGGSLIIERALARETGVLRAHVNPSTEMAYVEYDAERTQPAWLVAAVQRSGFRATQAGTPGERRSNNASH